MLLFFVFSFFVTGHTGLPIAPRAVLFHQNDFFNTTTSSSNNVTNSATTWYPRTTTWRPSTSTWYPTTSTWFPRRTAWYQRTTAWYPRTTTWHPQSSTWYHRSPTSKVICNNYRDLSVKELPKVGDLMCDVDGYYDRYSWYFSQTNDLLSRETIVRMDTTPRSDWYSKLVSGTISKVNVLNFGNNHAFVEKITIENNGYGRATVNVRIQVPEGQEVKLFVEIYGRKE